MTSTLCHIFLTKRFCKRIQKMLAAEGIVAVFKVHKDVYGHPCGQDIGINFDYADDINTINAVFRAYKAKYSLRNESDFNLRALEDGITLTWDSAFQYDDNYWTAYPNSISEDGTLFRSTCDLAVKPT